MHNFLAFFFLAIVIGHDGIHDSSPSIKREIEHERELVVHITHPVEVAFNHIFEEVRERGASFGICPLSFSFLDGPHDEQELIKLYFSTPIFIDFFDQFLDFFPGVHKAQSNEGVFKFFDRDSFGSIAIQGIEYLFVLLPLSVVEIDILVFAVFF